MTKVTGITTGGVSNQLMNGWLTDDIITGEIKGHGIIAGGGGY